MAEGGKRILLGGGAAALLTVALAAAWFWQHYRQFLETPLKLPEKGLVVEVAGGETAAGVARRLEAKGVLDSAALLRFHLRLHPELGKIKAGEYLLEAGTTPVTMLKLLVSGHTRLHEITFPEGWTFRQWRRAMDRHPALKHRLTGLSDAQVMERLGHPGVHPEGRFFPDTYLFPKGFSDLQLLQRAWRRMEQELSRAWKERAEGLPLNTPDELLILASIVEKETARPDERRRIAGVFVRRLRKGMKLQTDPTVIYGMGARYQGNIRRSDLREDTPYNTYVHAGLPPTPICMPGRAALQAAAHPAQGKALYFVARGDGSHQFSETLRGHNRAVRRYQLKKR